MKQRGIMNRKIPTALGLLILVAGLVAGIFLVNNRTSLETKAGPTEAPKNIKITNRGSNSVSISWTTDVPMTGYIRYSEDPGKINTPAGDVRDQISGTSQSYTNHYVNLAGLNPNKQYYFNIGSGSQIYNDAGRPFQLKTLLNLSSPQEDVVHGKVISVDGSPINSAIVFLDLDGAETLSTITKSDGGWRINLSSARTKEGSLPKIDPKSTVLSIFVQAGSSGTATAITNTDNSHPVPDIVTGKNQSFIETQGSGIILATDNSSRSAEFNLDESQLTSLVDQTATSGITFVNPAIEGELIATSTPELKIKLASGSAVILRVGEQSSEELLGTEDGYFSWSPPIELASGLNTLEVDYLDGNSQPQSTSRIFNVLSVGDVSGLPAFVSTPSATIEITPTPTEASTMPETTEEYLNDSGSLETIVSLVVIGLSLIVGGSFLKKKWH